jgi:hypothetical protein
MLRGAVVTEVEQQHRHLLWHHHTLRPICQQHQQQSLSNRNHGRWLSVQRFSEHHRKVVASDRRRFMPALSTLSLVSHSPSSSSAHQHHHTLRTRLNPFLCPIKRTLYTSPLQIPTLAGQPGPRPVDIAPPLDQPGFDMSSLANPSIETAEEMRILSGRDPPSYTLANKSEASTTNLDLKGDGLDVAALDIMNDDDVTFLKQPISTVTPLSSLSSEAIPLTRPEIRVRFTPEEDRLLLECVRTYGPKFKLIAKAHFSHRSYLSLRQRWIAINPEFERSSFTVEEDEILLEAVNKVGKKWAIIHETLLPKRSPLQISTRYMNMPKYHNKSNSNSNTNNMKKLNATTEPVSTTTAPLAQVEEDVKDLPPWIPKDQRPWAEKEDQQIMRDVELLGYKWSLISQGLKDRSSPYICVHYWNSLYKRHKKFQLEPSPATSLSSTNVSTTPANQLLKKQPWEPWCQEEDDIILDAVTRLWRTTNRPWMTISNRHLPHRTPFEIRLRWYNVLDPRVLDVAFTKGEDRLLVEAVRRLGKRFAMIARLKGFEGRTGEILRWKYERMEHHLEEEEQVENHGLANLKQVNEDNVDVEYHESIAESEKVSEKKRKNIPWTDQEDTIILTLKDKNYPYAEIAARVPGRTTYQVRRRYYQLRDRGYALTSSLERREWTVMDDTKLLELFDEMMKGEMAKPMPRFRSKGRSEKPKVFDVVPHIKRVYDPSYHPDMDTEGSVSSELKSSSSSSEKLPRGIWYSLSKLMGRHPGVLKTKYFQLRPVINNAAPPSSPTSTTTTPTITDVDSDSLPPPAKKLTISTFGTHPPTPKDHLAIVTAVDLTPPNERPRWFHIGLHMQPPRNHIILRNWAIRWAGIWDEERDVRVCQVVERELERWFEKNGVNRKRSGTDGGGRFQEFLRKRMEEMDLEVRKRWEVDMRDEKQGEEKEGVQVLGGDEKKAPLRDVVPNSKVSWDMFEGAGYSKIRTRLLDDFWATLAEKVNWGKVGAEVFAGQRSLHDAEEPIAVTDGPTTERKGKNNSNRVSGIRREMEIRFSNPAERCKRRWVFLKAWESRTGKKVVTDIGFGGSSSSGLSKEDLEELNLYSSRLPLEKKSKRQSQVGKAFDGTKRGDLEKYGAKVGKKAQKTKANKNVKKTLVGRLKDRENLTSVLKELAEEKGFEVNR